MQHPPPPPVVPGSGGEPAPEATLSYALALISVDTRVCVFSVVGFCLLLLPPFSGGRRRSLLLLLLRLRE